MKTILSRWGWCALLAMSGLALRAGAPAPKPPPSPPTTTLPASSATPVESSQESSPDTPISAPTEPPDNLDFSDGDPEKIAEQTMAFQEQQREKPEIPALEVQLQQQAAASDRDWMLRDYTARLQKAGLAPATPAPSDPGTLAQPSATPAPTADPLAQPSDAPLTPEPFPTTESETKPELSKSSLSSLSSLQPLMPPLNSPALKAPRDPWGTAPASSDFVPTSDLNPLPTPRGDTDAASSSLDVPGLTAAESGMGHSAGSLDFEGALPDDSGNGPRKIDDQNNFLVPTAPVSDVTEFFKKQAEGLRAPTAPNVIEAPTVVARPVTPLPPEPIAKPAVSGLRSHVDDPFDILRQ